MKTILSKLITFRLLTPAPTGRAPRGVANFHRSASDWPSLGGTDRLLTAASTPGYCRPTPQNSGRPLPPFSQENAKARGQLYDS